MLAARSYVDHEALERVLVLEPDDGPRLGTSGVPDGFDPVVAVLDHELAVVADDDDGGPW